MLLIFIRRGLLTILLAVYVTVASSAAPRIENTVTIADPKWPDEYRRAYAGKEGEAVPMNVLREGKPLQLEVKIRLGEASNWNLRRLPESTARQKELYDRWISGK
jgi:hypothetical protein